ncbi:hypothetical protein AVEN_152074-1 [Araneus ventricosus]|uniref:Uncharacterized protein n=1 Tax=Araneus ventricosus TaxID=182803 RepID=A0A4Y2SP34_ARAVE|nr:hypothetical protein AVEN_152074-1 [Araneus ventricosus]
MVDSVLTFHGPNLTTPWSVVLTPWSVVYFHGQLLFDSMNSVFESMVICLNHGQLFDSMVSYLTPSGHFLLFAISVPYKSMFAPSPSKKRRLMISHLVAVQFYCLSILVDCLTPRIVV